jgi:uncharacterized phage-associated protein
MTASAHDVAAELRARLPGLLTKKLHKLLYYAQGHHLAASGEPLFSDEIFAWDMGPVVSSLWSAENRGEAPPGSAALGEAELNTIGYVVSRYGKLTGSDLQHLTHGELPWQQADAGRPLGGSARIERDWMRDYFRGPGSAAADQDVATITPGDLASLVSGAEERRRTGAGRVDDPEEFRRRIKRLAARG